MAPDAKIRAYRVLGCGGGTSADTLITGLLAAVADKVDVINLSLGGPNGWPDEPLTALVSRIVAQGTAVAVAAGNDGTEGAAYVDAPGDSNGLSVGSVENVDLVTYSIFAEGTSDGVKQIPLLSAKPFEIHPDKLPVKIVDSDLHSTSDACDPAATVKAGPFNNSVVIVGQGYCDLGIQFENIFANGGQYVLYYGRPPPAGVLYIGPELDEGDGRKVSTLLREDALYLKQQINAGRQIQLDFSRQVLFILPNTVNGGRMSPFSSLGPDWTLGGSPAVSVPGGNILGAWPLSKFVFQGCRA